MAKSLSILVAVAGLAAAGALALRGGQDDAGAQTAAAEVDAVLRETAAGIHSRATTLAELPRLSAAVATDSATVRDLTASELMFRPRKGETIEIGQVFRSGNVISLLRLPERASWSPLDRAGVHLTFVHDVLMLTEVVDVVPSERADQLRGAIAVAWPVELGPVVAKLDAAGLTGRLEVAGQIVPLSSRAGKPGGPTVAAPITSVPSSGARAVLDVVRPAPLPSLALALVSLVVSALLWRRKPAAAAPPPALVEAPLPAARSGVTPLVGAPSGTAPTEMGMSVALSQQQVGRYTILRPLGSGGMAEVYLARTTGEAGFEKLVALKVLHKQLAVQAVVVEHFLDEAKLASRLTHPNIVQITDLGKAGDDYFIAMEYIDGADLERLLGRAAKRHAPVPLKVALAILRKICDGLHAAHTAKADDGTALDIVHRDVKSANVFVAKNGSVKVGDFGIAKANQVSRVNKTEIGQVKGTAAYMPPEQRTGQPVDRRADLYAVGAIAYELLTGTEINLDLALLAERGRQGWPHLTPPSKLRPEVPPELDAIVWKALAYEKSERYGSCEELEEALAAVVEQHHLGAGEKVIAQWIEAELAEDSTRLRVTPSS